MPLINTEKLNEVIRIVQNLLEVYSDEIEAYVLYEWPDYDLRQHWLDEVEAIEIAEWCYHGLAAAGYKRRAPITPRETLESYLIELTRASDNAKVFSQSRAYYNRIVYHSAIQNFQFDMLDDPDQEIVRRSRCFLLSQIDELITDALHQIPFGWHLTIVT
ncbi:MAG TPA: hypothetical protein PLT26_09740 [Anaerolineaceae bacterium]|nr:hypothetical protein [Anaerolineaceae bacterium]HQH85832.1 hypothetical protein [Anaerolineaceae bacterium]